MEKTCPLWAALFPRMTDEMEELGSSYYFLVNLEKELSSYVHSLLFPGVDSPSGFHHLGFLVTRDL